MYCSKCYDERKYTRLELATWQDKVPIIVGIEEILKVMMDGDQQIEETETSIEEQRPSSIDWNENHTYCLCEKESGNKTNYSNTNTSQCEPLDLSRLSSTSINEIDETPIPRKSIVSNSNYSERELISAVRAICCGRIGTRRAAALYGIPRSTLRNRIFKVYDAKKTHEGDETISMVDFFKKIMKDDSMFANVFQKYQRESKEDKRKVIANEKEGHIKNINNRQRDNHVSNKELFKTELDEVMKHHQQNDSNNELDLNNDEYSLDPFNFAANIPDIFNGYFPQSNHFQNLMSSYLYMMCQQNILSSVYGSMITPSWQLPNFDIGNFSLSQTESNEKPDCPDLKFVNNKDGDIKLEKMSSSDNSPNVFEQDCPDVPDLLTNMVSNSFQESDSIFLNSDDIKEDLKQQIDSTSNLKSDFNIAVLSDETSESSRHKKRGHYRQYNTDMLNKAIEAVRSGEMSVHKAGNHFGVPHSTLEYRVKQITDGVPDEKLPNKRGHKKSQSSGTEINKRNDSESKRTDSDGCNTTSSSLKSQV